MELAFEKAGTALQTVRVGRKSRMKNVHRYTGLSSRDNWQRDAIEQGSKAHDIFENLLSVYVDKRYPGKYEVRTKPRIPYPEGDKRVELDIGIKNKETDNQFFLEIKNQGETDRAAEDYKSSLGNGHERAYKFLPMSGLVRYIKDYYGYLYLPVGVVFSGRIVDLSDPRSLKYRQEINIQYKDCEEFVLLWDNYDIKYLRKFVEKTILPRIDGLKRDKISNIRTVVV